jgi:uncharacterized membrane protein
LQLWRARPRLYAAIISGVVIGAVGPSSLSGMQRAAIGWDGGIVLYLALLLLMALRATPETMHRRAQLEDATRWAFLGLMATTAWFAMFALLGILHDARGAEGRYSVVLTLFAAATIVLSWLFAHTAFAIHYAHDYYTDQARKKAQGLLFPGDERDPDYWDFLYFSFVVGMTCQVSDVQVATRPWRRLVLAHGVLSFLFNTVVLALSINLLAGSL